MYVPAFKNINLQKTVQPFLNRYSRDSGSHYWDCDELKRTDPVGWLYALIQWLSWKAYSQQLSEEIYSLKFTSLLRRSGTV